MSNVLSPSMATVPAMLVDILKKRFPVEGNSKGLQEASRYVVDLSRWFTQKKGLEPQSDYMGQKKFRDAYILYYLPPNFLKVFYLLGKAESLCGGKWLEKKEFSILDAGCGPGTAGIAAAFFFHAKKRGENFRLRIVSLDRSPEILKENIQLTQDVSSALKKESPGFEVEHQTLRLGVLEGISGLPLEFDAVFFSNVLAEMGPPEKERDLGIIHFVQKALAPTGLAFFLEPAQRIYARTLLSLRDAFAGENGFSILSPCPPVLKCPALGRSEKDWCHDDIHWERPDYIAGIDRFAGLRKESLKFTHLIVSKGIHGIKKTWAGDRFVVVSELIAEKGKISAFLCGKDGRFRFELLRKDESESNGAFLSLKRGEIISLQGFSSEGETRRLNKNSVVIAGSG